MHYHRFGGILKKINYDEYLTDVLPEIAYDIRADFILHPSFKDEDKDEWIRLKNIGDLEEMFEYNDKVDEYKNKHPDKNINFLNYDLCVKYPAIINDKLIDCEEFYYYVIANSYGEFHVAFNKSVIDYYSIQLNLSKKLEMPDEYIDEIQMKINKVKGWFVENIINPNDGDTFIDDYKKPGKIYISKNKGGRPPDPKKAKLREKLNHDYFTLTEKQGLRKSKAIEILTEKYPWKKTTIEKYIKI